MSKKYGSGLLAILLAVSVMLAGCGGGGADPMQQAAQQPEESQSQQQETPAGEGTGAADGESVVKFWTKNRHDLEFMYEQIDLFEAANPGIKIEMEVYTDNYLQTLDLAASTNELPDVFTLQDQTTTTTMIIKNAMASLDGYLTEEELARYPEGSFIEGVNMQDGNIISLPTLGFAWRLVYNQDLFDEMGFDGPPQTLDQMVEYTKQITDEKKSEGIYGFALPMKTPSSGLGRGFIAIPTLSGAGNREGFDYRSGAYDFTPFATTLEAFREIFDGGYAFPGCESMDIDPLRTQFAEGKIGMYMTWNHSEWGVYTDQFPTDINWQYAPLPTENGQVTGSQPLNAGTWLAISSTSQDPDSAWKWIAFTSTDDFLSEYHALGLGLCTVPSAVEKASPPESIVAIPAIAFQEYDKIWPLQPQGVTPEGNDFYTTFSNIIFGVDADMDTSLADLADRYNAAYDKAKADGIAEDIRYPNFDAANPGATAN